MSAPHLLLWLEGPLQAWGHDSKFSRRDTLDFPTKSGVLGLVCCARGASGAQTDWLRRWADLDMQVQAYVPLDRQGLAASRLPLLGDCHMVGNGYDHKDPWQDLLIPKTSDGKRPVGSGAKMTYRYYLQDVAFAVSLQAPAEEADSVVEALRNPVWDLYLGRKSCAPTEFVFQGLFRNADEAMNRANELASTKGRGAVMHVLQGEYEGEVLTLNDVPIQFGEQKRYRDRRVTIVKAE